MTEKVKKQPNYALITFFAALGIAAAFFVPFLIYNKGYFIFLGDFNVQQIPFYKLAHEAVRSGDIFWNWNTDLGVNFIGSYSFYLLFSPFFWLTLPFPTDFVPHLMGPLLILKTACAALTGFFFIKRFVKDKSYAVLGALLYAFSGFMTFNIFFNHFHEVVVFFPLLLISLEELVEHNRRGFFALMVALNCMVNYWFFIGEVVFVLIYVVVRIATGGWPITVKKFFAIAFESVLGVLLACFALMPSVLALMGNPRTTGDNILTGWLMWIYGYSQRLPAIIASLFFPPELPSQPNFFPEMGAKWSSLSAFLPLFSTCGVFAYLKTKHKDFIKRLLILCAFMACIPILNSAFILFNGSYYARWFYMPILLMCVATAVALEERRSMNWKSGVAWTAFATVFIAVAVGLSPLKQTEEGQAPYKIGLMQYPSRFWAYVGIALIGLILTVLLIKYYRDHRYFQRICGGMMAVMIVSFTVFFFITGKNSPANDRWMIEVAIEGRDQLHLPDEGFVRSDIYEGMDNLGMFWGLPNIQAFHSIVPPSIMEFYPAVGIKRDVSSKPGTQYVALRSMLSVKWLFIAQNNKTQDPMPGYSFYDNQLGYNIYQNDNFLPMGFGYTETVSEEDLKLYSGEQKTRVMLYALVLDDKAQIRNMDVVDRVSAAPYMVDEEGYREALDLHAKYACDSFTIDNHGFTATCNLPREMMMFFSVPYEKGWSATVNGKAAVVEKANIGFMAVRVPAGETTIRFQYKTPGLKAGMILTAVGLLLLAGYLLIVRLLRRRAPVPAAHKAPSPSQMSMEDYLNALDELPGEPEPPKLPKAPEQKPSDPPENPEGSDKPNE